MIQASLLYFSTAEYIFIYNLPTYGSGTLILFYIFLLLNLLSQNLNPWFASNTNNINPIIYQSVIFQMSHFQTTADMKTDF